MTKYNYIIKESAYKELKSPVVSSLAKASINYKDNKKNPQKSTLRDLHNLFFKDNKGKTTKVAFEKWLNETKSLNMKEQERTLAEIIYSHGSASRIIEKLEEI